VSDDRRLRVPDSELDFGPGLVMHYVGKPFSGISFEVSPDGRRCELSYVEGLQHGPTREWDESGRLRFEDRWEANARHGPARTFDEAGIVKSEQWWDHDRRVDAPPI
jgi:antitoxin component YwqK of YwqJK toxin-antitoxin module